MIPFLVVLGLHLGFVLTVCACQVSGSAGLRAFAAGPWPKYISAAFLLVGLAQAAAYGWAAAATGLNLDPRVSVVVEVDDRGGAAPDDPSPPAKAP